MCTKNNSGENSDWCNSAVNFKDCMATIIPVANTAGKVQTGLTQVLLQLCLLGYAATLGADMWCAALVDALVSSCTAAIRQEHGRRTFCAGLQNRRIRKWQVPKESIKLKVSKYITRKQFSF